MRRNQKKRLTDWLTTFVEVAADLSADLALEIKCGSAEVVLPGDVLEILKRRGVVFVHHGATFFEYQSEVGAVLLKVIGEKDPRFSMRLTLQKSRA